VCVVANPAETIGGQNSSQMSVAARQTIAKKFAASFS
jgi:hypothetical protein